MKFLIEAWIWDSVILGFGGEVLCGRKDSSRALTEMLVPSGGV